jgi:hypothetical protein
MNGARVGYARCSTDEQDVDIQIEQLTALGVAPERIYIDRGGTVNLLGLSSGAGMVGSAGSVSGAGVRRPWLCR